MPFPDALSPAAIYTEQVVGNITQLLLQQEHHDMHFIPLILFFQASSLCRSYNFYSEISTWGNLNCRSNLSKATELYQNPGFDLTVKTLPLHTVYYRIWLMAFILDSLAILADTMKTDDLKPSYWQSRTLHGASRTVSFLVFPATFGLLVILGIALPYPGHVGNTNLLSSNDISSLFLGLKFLLVKSRQPLVKAPL